MNTTAVASAMMAAAEHKNVSFSDVLGGSFFLKYDPMVAPQKDGNYTLVRVYRREDQKETNLSREQAEALLRQWLGDVILDMPNAKVEARYQAALQERGWHG